MSVAHLSYVVCDACGLPASSPEEDAGQARRMIPPDWSRVKMLEGRHRDFCASCSVLPTVTMAYPGALPGLEDW